jgi:hypothetical protein
VKWGAAPPPPLPAVRSMRDRWYLRHPHIGSEQACEDTAQVAAAIPVVALTHL